MQSFPRFVTAVKESGLKIPSKTLKAFYDKQTVNQLTKVHKRPRLFRHFIWRGVGRNLGMDAIYLNRSGRPRFGLF